MKFVTFELMTQVGAIRRIGVLEQAGIMDLQSTYGQYLREEKDVWRWQEIAHSLIPSDMLGFIEGGEVSMEAAHHALSYFQRVGGDVTESSNGSLWYAMHQVKLLAPIPRPVAFIDCSAFMQHHTGMGNTRRLPEVFYQIPAHYRTSTTDVAGPDAVIHWPSYTELLDYELEFAVCIGKYGVNIPVEKAGEHIFGYTIFNDVSARDIQRREMALGLGPAKGKCFQNSNIIGPCLVTPDELNVDSLRMTARINGELWSDGNSGDMYFKFPQLISYLSDGDPLYPGTIIGSGTIGNGCGAELGKWLKQGDIIELEVEGIGILKNRVERRT